MELTNVDIEMIISALRNSANDHEDLAKKMQVLDIPLDQKRDYRNAAVYVRDLYKRVENYRETHNVRTFTLQAKD